MMFEGFQEQRIEVTETEIHLVRGGSGPPLLLVHGYPQNHVMWHRVAPTLAKYFTVVAPDLRGYGASGKPPAGSDHAGYSKRAMARDLVEVMAALGFDRFSLVGHDRGARASYRLALDHPGAVEKLVLLDIVPTSVQFAQVDWQGCLRAYHWYLLAQPAPLPETLIGNNAEFFIRHTLENGCHIAGAISEEAMAAYITACTPETIRGICSDYRAGMFVDRVLDTEDREAGRTIACPTLVVWGDPGGTRPSYLDPWKDWATDLRGRRLDCGHFIPEEAPEELIAELLPFLGAPA
jgi:haloacetate dehalogenase